MANTPIEHASAASVTNHDSDLSLAVPWIERHHDLTGKGGHTQSRLERRTAETGDSPPSRTAEKPPVTAWREGWPFPWPPAQDGVPNRGPVHTTTVAATSTHSRAQATPRSGRTPPPGRPGPGARPCRVERRRRTATHSLQCAAGCPDHAGRSRRGRTLGYLDAARVPRAIRECAGTGSRRGGGRGNKNTVLAGCGARRFGLGASER